MEVKDIISAVLLVTKNKYTKIYMKTEKWISTEQLLTIYMLSQMVQKALS